MPQITPNQTNHLRQNATFRGTRANPYATPALERSNRTKKRKLINRARAALRWPKRGFEPKASVSRLRSDLQAAAVALVSVKRRWVKLGSAGAEHDRKLKKEFGDIYEQFGARYARVRARAIARRAQAATDPARQDPAAGAAPRARATPPPVRTPSVGGSVAPPTSLRPPVTTVNRLTQSREQTTTVNRVTRSRICLSTVSTQPTSPRTSRSVRRTTSTKENR